MDLSRYKAVAISVYQRILHLGDDFGKLAKFIAIPGAVLALVAYSTEIWDTFTPHDVKADIKSVELRCGLELGGQAQVDAANNDFGMACGKAPTSISFEVTLTNEDSVARTLVEIWSNVALPKDLGVGEKPMELRLVRVVSHSVVNYLTYVTSEPWQVIRLAPYEVRKIEVEFRPLAQTEMQDFAHLRDAIRDTSLSLEGQVISAEFWAVFSDGGPNDTPLTTCAAPIKLDSVKRKRKLADNDFVSFVQLCER